jgi:putative DNA primase/helicase
MSTQENQAVVTNQAEHQQQDKSKEPEINPIVLAKKIAQKHVFVVEKLPNSAPMLYVYNEKEGIYTRNVEPIIKGEMCKILDIKTRVRYYQDVENWLRFSPETPKVEFNQHPEFIAVKNGILNLLTKKLDDFKISYFITNKIPHNYNQQADKDNNKIVKFIAQVMSKEHMALIQEWLGQALYRNITSDRLIILLIGDGNNGKSVFIDACSFLIGKDNIEHVTLQALSEDKFASACLKDKIANFVADLPTAPLKYMGLIKMISTSDWVTSQFKHKDLFKWQPIISLMFSCNKAPEINPAEDSTGTFRRLQVIGFPFTFGDKDHPENKNLRQELFTEQEAEGFLLWCLEGLDKLRKNGSYSNRETVQETRKTYIKKSNNCQAFLDECTESTDEPEDWFLTDKAYKFYLSYCKKEKLPPCDIRKFSISVGLYCHGAEKFQTKEKLRAWRFVRVRGDAWVKYRAESTDRADLLTFLQKSDTKNYIEKVQASALIAPSAPEETVHDKWF